MTHVDPKVNPTLLAFILGVSMLFIGMCGISYEYTFSRLASDILGNSIKQWAIIIGLMMLFMGIGADLQKYFPDRLNVDQFIFLEVLLGVVGGFGPSITLYAFGHFHDHFIIAHYFFICAIGLMIGLEIPILSRVNEVVVPSLKHNLGLILKMDYIGSFIGALVWVFVLPRFFNILEISFFLGIINVLVAAFTWFWFHKWMTYSREILAVIIIALAMLTIGIFNGKEITITAEQKLYKDPIVFTQTSPFQRIVITQKPNGPIYLYINGHLQFSSFDEFIYHEFLVHPILAVSGEAKRVLVLGGGDGLAVREILKYKQVESITLVDIDPAMTDLAKSHPLLTRLNRDSLSNSKTIIRPNKGISPGDPYNLTETGVGFFRRQKSVEDVQISIANIDAYEFVESIPGIYDAIILDFPDPNNQSLSKLYSMEFYSLLKSKLSFDGLIIQQSSSPVFAKESFLVIGRTMKAAGFSAIPIQHTVPSFGNWGWWIAGHGERYGKTGLKSLLSMPPHLPSEVRYITDELIHGSLNFGKDALKTDKTDINTILDDRVFLYYLNAWKQIQ